MNHSTTTSNLPTTSLKLAGLTQARGTLSLKRIPSRLGEGATREQWVLRRLAQARPFSPKRDCTSLKMKPSRLGDYSCKSFWASPLLVSPRRGMLAWARKLVPATVYSHNRYTYPKPKSQTTFLSHHSSI